MSCTVTFLLFQSRCVCEKKSCISFVEFLCFMPPYLVITVYSVVNCWDLGTCQHFSNEKKHWQSNGHTGFELTSRRARLIWIRKQVLTDQLLGLTLTYLHKKLPLSWAIRDYYQHFRPEHLWFYLYQRLGTIGFNNQPEVCVSCMSHCVVTMLPCSQISAMTLICSVLL